jgi:hypothetical protein
VALPIKNLVTPDLDYAASIGRVIGERSVLQNLDGSGDVIIGVLPRNLPGGTEENHERHHSGHQMSRLEIQT